MMTPPFCGVKDYFFRNSLTFNEINCVSPVLMAIMTISSLNARCSFIMTLIRFWLSTYFSTMSDSFSISFSFFASGILGYFFLDHLPLPSSTTRRVFSCSMNSITCSSVNLSIISSGRRTA